MYCPQCGTQNSDSARYCLSCGTAFVMGEIPPAPTPLPQATPVPPPSAPAGGFSPYVAEPMAVAVPQVRYAGFWIRLLAWILDALALSILRMALRTALSGFVSWTAVICAGWLYFALMESSEMQATAGKMALGLYVTDMEGRRISFGKASGRFFGKILSTLMLGIGYLLAAFTERKQALHDLIAGCLVLRR